MHKQHIGIIGSGLVGSLLSIYLAKRGYKITVFERRADPRKSTIYAGKSINLALSDRGWLALEKTGIADEIKKIAIPMNGRFIHHKDGSTNYQAYGKEGQAIYSVSRGELNMKLIDLAEKQANISLHFNSKAENVNAKTSEIIIEKDNEHSIHKFDKIIATDGAFSAGRLSVQLQTDRFNYQQFYIEAGYKELCIPAGKNGAFVIEKNALHIWPRGKYMMIALPNNDGSFTCTLFFPFEGQPSFSSLNSNEAILEFFKEDFPDAVSIMPTLLDDFNTNPTSSLVTVKCYPWVNKNLALMGDAAHAIVPFFGQGMNCGFEDVRIFDELLTKYDSDWDMLFEEYQKLRKPDTDAIADLAIGNFVEMRDLVTLPKFILQKKIEAHFSTKHPEKWIPAYSMVTFSPKIRYSEALKKGQQQQSIMDKVMKLNNIAQKWNSEEVEMFILNQLTSI